MTDPGPSRLCAPGGDGIAVVTRTKDRPLLLARAIESVLAQSHQNWVHAIVNDGGAEAPVEELVERYLPRYGERLIVIHNGASRGMEAASNIGLRATDSYCCVIHDDDDAWHPEFLAEAIRALESRTSPNYRGVVCWSDMVSERIDGDTVSETQRVGFNSWLRDVSLWRMLYLNSFPPISFLFERAALAEIGLFDESLPVLGDWEFNLRFLKRFDIAVLPKTLAYYHIREAGAPAAFVNTITGSSGHHMTQRTLLINHLVRKELDTGKLGLGTLINLATDLHELREQTRQKPNQLGQGKGLLVRLGKVLGLI